MANSAVECGKCALGDLKKKGNSFVWDTSFLRASFNDDTLDLGVKV